MAYHIADAKREFDFWSHTYDWNPLQLFFFGPTHKLILDELRPEDHRILDIGCGTGVFARRALQRLPEAEVWGMDLSDGMLRKCESRCRASAGRLHLVQGNSERLPFRDNAFDVVTCAHSFHHYPDQERVAAEMHRVLRPGGRVIIADGDRDRWWGHFVFEIIVVFVEGNVKHLTSFAFRKVLQAAGFRDMTQERCRGPLPFLLTVGSAFKPAMPVRKAA